MSTEDNIASPFQLLYENASRGVFFHLLIAALLGLCFWHYRISGMECLAWFSVIFSLNILRIFLLKSFQHDRSYETKPYLISFSLSALMFALGCTWAFAYLVFLPQAHGMREGLMILIMGGMSIGSIPSLAPYLSIYLSYILPMIVPVIFVSYSYFSMDYTIFGTMVIAFLAMLIIAAIQYRRLSIKTLSLDEKQRHLVQQLFESNERLKMAFLEITRISRTDALTELPNRRAFDETLEKEWQRSLRDKTELSLLLIDIDNFKIINDGLGHPEGDEYLKAVSKIMFEHTKRASDFLARIGGDEFAVILINTPLKNAVAVAENLRKAIADFNRKIYPEKNISISIGLSSNATEISIHNLISEADKHLYEAKAQGKNRVSAR